MVRKTDIFRASRQELDLTRPLPPEHALNVGFLLEIPLGAIEGAIVKLLAERGFDDIRPAHSKVFTTISGDGSRLTDMAAKALLTKQSMQYLVDDLERLGYAERISDPEDRRAKLVRLTPRGREAVLVGRQAIAATERRWAEALGEERMSLLRELLEELVTFVRAEETESPARARGRV